MSYPAKIDILIASLYPHIASGFCGNILQAGRSLRPSDAEVHTASYDIADSFATLFGHHPGCDAAAVTIQVTPSRTAQLYVCPSPIIPNAFEYNVKRWVDQFTSLRKESTGRGPDGKFSPLMQGFILDTYRLCYEAMRQRSEEFGMWPVLASFEASEVTSDSKSVAGLRKVSELVKHFLESMSDLSLESDQDILRFHGLCLALQGVLQDEETMDLVGQYMYPKGVDGLLFYLSLPKAVSTLFRSVPSQDPFRGECSITMLKPSLGARQFSTTVTMTHFAECFGEVAGIDWKDVYRAFDEVVEMEDIGRGVQWDAEKHVLSTADVVTVHPEITLLRYLMKKSDVKGETYIACSRLPCYASVRYVEAVNQVIRPARAFTMRTNHPDWCRLAEVEPWILPDATSQEVSARMARMLLRDLSGLVDYWKNNPLNGVANISSDEDEEDDTREDGGDSGEENSESGEEDDEDEVAGEE